MLHIKVDLIPQGNESERRQINEVWIANIGQKGSARAMGSTYWYGVFLRHPREQGGIPDYKVRHDRNKSVWMLLRLALGRMLQRNSNSF